MKLDNEKTKIEEDQEETDEVDNKLELLKYMTKILSRGIKRDVTPDFVMAKLHPKDKEALIEMTNNAYFSKRNIQTLKQRGKWTYNNTTKTWIQNEMNEEDKKKIDEITDKMFDTFMTRNIMTAILNRNVKDNHILRLLSGFDTEEDKDLRSTPTQEEETNRIKKVWQSLGFGKKQEEEET